jgi:hypothetical protein
METVHSHQLPLKLDQLTEGLGNCFPLVVIQQCRRPLQPWSSGVCPTHQGKLMGQAKCQQSTWWREVGTASNPLGRLGARSSVGLTWPRAHDKHPVVGIGGLKEEPGANQLHKGKTIVPRTLLHVHYRVPCLPQSPLLTLHHLLQLPPCA